MPGSANVCVTVDDAEGIVSGVPSPNCHLKRTLTPPLAVAVYETGAPASCEGCGGIGATDNTPLPLIVHVNAAIAVCPPSLTVTMVCVATGLVGIPVM